MSQVIFQVTVDAIAVALCIAMVLKLAEVLYHARQHYPIDRVAGGTFPLNIEREWPISARIAPFFMWVPEKYRYQIFRYRTILGAIFICTSWISAGFSGIVACTVLMAIWIMVGRELIDQVKYGSRVQFRGPVIRSPLGVRSFGGSEESRRVRQFVTSTLGLAASIALSYAIVYDRLQACLRGKAFTEVPESYQLLHFVYFSVVTLATVGYGDIIPAKDQVTPRLIVASEIVIGFVFVTIVLSVVALTFGNDQSTSVRSAGESPEG